MTALRHTLVLLVCFVLAHASGVRADATSDARAAQLFDEARELMERGEYASACRKLEHSQRLDPQLGTQLHLGHCFEKLGNLAAAHRTFQAAAQVAAQRNQEGVEEPREKIARERAVSLEPQLSLLELKPADPRKDLTIALDGAAIDRTQWSHAIAIEPGDHVLRASAPGRASWQQTFTIGAPARLGIGVPALLTQALAKAHEPEVAPSTALVAQPTDTRSSSRSGLRIAGYVTVGVGVVGLGLGTLFAVVHMSKMSQLQGDCDLDRGLCMIEPGDSAARDRIGSLYQQASGFATLANVAWIAGGVAAAGGVVLILISQPKETPTLTLGISPGGLSFTARTNAL